MTQVKTSVSSLLDHAKGEVFFAAAHFLKKFDIAARKVELIKDYSIGPKGAQWFFYRARLENNQVLFTGSKEVRAFHNCVGIFDLTESRVTWHYELPAKSREFFVGAPVLHGDRLYVSDDQDNLYIFQRE